MFIPGKVMLSVINFNEKRVKINFFVYAFKCFLMKFFILLRLCKLHKWCLKGMEKIRFINAIELHSVGPGACEYGTSTYTSHVFNYFRGRTILSLQVY